MQERKFNARMGKFYLLCCLLPAAIAGGLFYMGIHFWNRIPEGDIGFRYLVAVPPLAIATFILVSVIFLIILNRKQSITIAPARLTFQDAGSMRSVNWGKVNLSGVVSGFMIRYSIISMGGKESRRLDSFFFPEFDMIMSLMEEMIRADRARGL